MATESQKVSFDLNAWFQGVQEQFSGLNYQEPGQWPVLPKMAAFVVVAFAMVLVGWFGLLSDAQTSLSVARDKEPQLRSDYQNKLAQAVNLPELRKQKSQVEEYVLQLEKQLPGKAEMDALLSDINQAGLGRGLQFELFRPGDLVTKDYYAEQPISIRVSGRYHDIGAFASDVSSLSRIVTLNNLNITTPTGKDTGSGNLIMEATARTYRYLDAGEVVAQRKAAKGAKK